MRLFVFNLATFKLSNVDELAPGFPETFSYDSQNLIAKTDKLGRTTTFEYDGLNRLYKTTFPDGRISTKTFVTDNETITKDLVASENVAGGIKSDQFLYFYDNQNRKTNSVHDTNKNGQQDVADRPTFSEFNGFGELVSVSGYDVYPVSYEYYNNGLLKSLTDGENNSTGFKYDFRRRLTEKIFANDNTNKFSYYKNSLLKSRIRNAVTTDYFYSQLGKITNTVYSDEITPSVSFTYNKLGQRLSMKDGSGKDTFYEYYSPSDQNGGFLSTLKNIKQSDTANQTFLFSSRTFRYFPHNLKRKSMEVFKSGTSVQKLDYEYDTANRLTKIKKGTDEYVYSYKQNWDLVSSVTAPEKNGSAVSQYFTYDGLGRRETVGTLNPLLGERNYIYNSAGQRSKQYLSGGFSINYNYDKAGQLISAGKYNGSNPYYDYSFTYQYDKIGNRIDEQRNGFNFDFLYNKLNQMTNRSWSGTLTAIGKTSPNPGLNSIDINAKNGDFLDNFGKYIVQSINVCEGDNNLITAVNKANPLPDKSIKWEEMNFEPNKINLKYDANGNLTNDGVRSYFYDAENRLIKCNTSILLVNYKYDGLGRKVLEQNIKTGEPIKENKLLYDGWNVIDETFITIVQAYPEDMILNFGWNSYIWGLDLSGTLQGAGGVGGLLACTDNRQPITDNFFYCYDGNGNVINLIDIDTKEIAAHYEYDPFGRLIEKEGSYADRNFYRFSTKRVSPVFGIYDYGMRWYDPDYKFWLSPDPIGEKGGLNLYGFVGNNPVSNIDPYGNIYIPGLTELAKKLWRIVINKTLVPRNWDVAALLMRHSLQNSPGKLTFNENHFVTQKVKKSVFYKRFIRKIVKKVPKNSGQKVSGTDSIAFRNGDLFAAINRARVEYKGKICRYKGRWKSKLIVKITDKYDFHFLAGNYYKSEFEKILGTVANNMAWSDQFFDVIHKFNIEINIKDERK